MTTLAALLIGSSIERGSRFISAASRLVENRRGYIIQVLAAPLAHHLVPDGDDHSPATDIKEVERLR